MTQKIHDLSSKDKKYFIDNKVYNCPFCNRKNVKYTVSDHFSFYWEISKKCYGYIIQCSESECQRTSLHLSYKGIARDDGYYSGFMYPPHEEKATYNKNQKTTEKILIVDKENKSIELDEVFFYHQPTSFFTLDPRIPKSIREPLNEAENCRKNNFLTGGSACLRKAIYKFLMIEQIPEKKSSTDEFYKYEERIDLLRDKLENKIDSDYFEILKSVHSISSTEVHENDWVGFDGVTLKLLIETIKQILYEIYIIPDERKKSKNEIVLLQNRIKSEKVKSAELTVNETLQ